MGPMKLSNQHYYALVLIPLEYSYILKDEEVQNLVKGFFCWDKLPMSSIKRMKNDSLIKI